MHKYIQTHAYTHTPAHTLSPFQPLLQNCVCVCVRMRECTCKSMFVRACARMCLYVGARAECVLVWVYARACMHLYTCVSVNEKKLNNFRSLVACTRVCVCVCACVCVYVRVCVCACMFLCLLSKVWGDIHWFFPIYLVFLCIYVLFVKFIRTLCVYVYDIYMCVYTSKIKNWFPWI